MIFKGFSDLSPTVNVAIDGVPVDYMSIKRLSVELTENMHNLVILEFAGLNPQLVDQYIDRPLTVSIQMRERPTASFCGYISHLEPLAVTSAGTVNNSPLQMTRVYCLGASYVMKSKRSRVWENNNIYEIVSEIAERYKFSVSVPRDEYRVGRLVQKAQSDWEFLVTVVNLWGYRMLMDGTHLHIWDPYKALNHRISYSALYTIRGLGGDPSPQPGQILKFDGRIGAVSPDGSRSYDTLHLLDKQGQLLSVLNEDFAEQSGLGVPVNSQFSNTIGVNADTYEMGSKIVEASLRKKFPMTAYVEAVGDPGIVPGGIVNIKEYNAQFDGFWYVTSVKHEIAQSSMVSFLKIAKDSLDGVTPSPNAVSPYVTPPSPALTNGKWAASQELVNVYI